MQVWVNQGISFGPVEHSHPTPHPLNLALQKLELVCKTSNFVQFSSTPGGSHNYAAGFQSSSLPCSSKLGRSHSYYAVGFQASFPVLQNLAEISFHTYYVGFQAFFLVFPNSAEVTNTLRDFKFYSLIFKTASFTLKHLIHDGFRVSLILVKMSHSAHLARMPRFVILYERPCSPKTHKARMQAELIHL